MVGIVLVSHSRPLAEAAKRLVQAMTGQTLPLAIAAGAGEDRSDLGTDAVEILEAIRSVMGAGGVLVLMDMGSAVLSAETALEFLEEDERGRVRLCAAPFLEGAIAAGVTANLGLGIEQVAQEAEAALGQKREHLRAGAAGQSAAEGGPSGAAETAAASGDASSVVLTVRNVHGLHARPAARFVQEAARFDAEVRVENLTAGKGPASAKSLSALTSLEVGKGHEIRVSARGTKAKEALMALGTLVESGLGDPATPAAEDRPAPVVTPPEQQQAEVASATAQPVSEGVAIGPALVVDGGVPVLPQTAAADAESEVARLRGALAAAKAGLLGEQEQARRSAGAQAADIFAAQALLLDDPALGGRAEQIIRRDRVNAALAWHRSVTELAERYQNFEDAYLRQRATDVRDVGRRVLGELGVRSEARIPTDREGILVVDDLTPTQVPRLADARLSGVVCLDGGATSHSSILLRAMGIPGVAQARQVLGEKASQLRGARLAFDGGTGEVWVDPDDRQLADIAARRERWAGERARQRAAAHEPAVTKDGHPVEVLANAGSVADADAAVRSGAEGIGLLRTEFLFLDRTTPPGEEEQVAALRPILERMGGRPVVVRTLDAGGDKELAYLGLAREANPFLGVRALRVSLRRPDLFRTQLRALLRAGAGHDVRIMFPMVSGPAELEEAKRQVDAAHASLQREGAAHAWPVKTGIMVEVPSAAVLADDLAARCDFFSIGTNDLTQYVLAADRGNPALGEFQDALHPAVLRLIRLVVDGARRHARPVAVCGEAAGDPVAALLFVGLGVGELSVAPPAVPGIKEAVRRVHSEDVRRLAEEAAKRTTAQEVREFVVGWRAAQGQTGASTP